MEHKLIRIDSTPDSNAKYCKVTLNIPWELAEKIAQFTAPFLQAVNQSVDTRTQEKIEQEEKQAKWEADYIKKRDKEVRESIKIIKKIHTQNLTYHQFCDLHPRIHFNKIKTTRLLYKRIKVWSVQQKHKKGISVAKIAESYDVRKSQIYSLLRENRREIYYKPRPDSFSRYAAKYS